MEKVRAAVTGTVKEDLMKMWSNMGIRVFVLETGEQNPLQCIWSILEDALKNTNFRWMPILGFFFSR